ncbi:hypothetical protein [Paenisporosarcina sp. TG-14]|uniref:hypothetical protein n=1 Tax=Paenisporosarcina sp. TG-14 TaxID=1231057 RepID=UPI00178C3921|nr:hypothetical protein [Paenisporosarcina sp. TG-14]
MQHVLCPIGATLVLIGATSPSTGTTLALIESTSASTGATNQLSPNFRHSKEDS